ncbi:uncharacterized protein Dwil_GK24631 [Drosophila willistoni]|uniref:Kinase n=1 Tax=Drosophila willistoni TaxID=7260 RepID=B4N0T3_DROWI|nr:inositol polyphosphate multikinase [Drosophila willistoni]EDW77696.2 uncharacterized protein Dwil_GK24631 [Drosophila willistoni]
MLVSVSDLNWPDGDGDLNKMAKNEQSNGVNGGPVLPNGFRQLDTQVAGHQFEPTNSSSSSSIGLLQDPQKGYVLKPLGKPECGERELNFYESLARARAGDVKATGESNDLTLASLSPYVPRFYGHLKLAVNQREHTFIRLEDLTRGMLQPCVMDVKMGRRTWDPESSPHKRQVEEQKYVICKQKLGLCLPGFQVYLPTNSTNSSQEGDHSVILRHGKDYGKSLNVAGFKQTMALFFNASTSDSKAQAVGSEVLLREILRQLREILDWFKHQRQLHFYASSLLICYDGSQLSHAKSSMLPSDWIRVRMIDFAHVYPAENGQPDENYMFGLESLIEVVESIHHR